MWFTNNYYFDDPNKPYKVYRLSVAMGGKLNRVPLSQHETLMQAMDSAEKSTAKSDGYVFVDTPEWKTWRLSGKNWQQVERTK